MEGHARRRRAEVARAGVGAGEFYPGEMCRCRTGMLAIRTVVAGPPTVGTGLSSVFKRVAAVSRRPA